MPRFFLTALIALSLSLGAPIAFGGPIATAAKEDPPVAVNQINEATAGVTGNDAAITGTGESILIRMRNKCSGLDTLCWNTVTLDGDYAKVIVEWSNECTESSRCFNTVIVRGSVEKLSDRGKDRVQRRRSVRTRDQSSSPLNTTHRAMKRPGPTRKPGRRGAARASSGRRAWRPRTVGADQLAQLTEQGRGLRGRQRLDRLAEAVGVGDR